MAEMTEDARSALLLAQRVSDAVVEGRYREALVMLRDMDDARESLIARCVQALRAEGATWSEIAIALDVSTQAAHKRFS